MIKIQKTGISLLLTFFTFAGAQAQQMESFKENDKYGLGMTLVAMAVVFTGLILLYLFFKVIGSVAVGLSRKSAMKASGLSKEEARNLMADAGEVCAAIAMAIHEITEDEHDDEDTVLTFNNVARNSPWSSKIYTLRELPRK